MYKKYEVTIQISVKGQYRSACYNNSWSRSPSQGSDSGLLYGIKALATALHTFRLRFRGRGN